MADEKMDIVPIEDIKIDPDKIDPIKRDPDEIGHIKVDPDQIDHIKRDPDKINNTKIDPGEMDHIKIDPDKINSMKRERDEIDPDEIDLNQMDISGDDDVTWYETDMDSNKFVFVWTLRNFSYLVTKVGERLKSLTFSAPQIPKYKWCLRIHPKGVDDANKDYVSLYLILVNSSKATVTADYKFAILDNDGKWENVKVSGTPMKFGEGKDRGFKRFIKRSVIMDPKTGLIRNDKVSIVCKVEVKIPSKTRAGAMRPSKPPQPVPSCSLGEDLSQLLHQNMCTDIKIICKGNAEVYAHKLILMMRSPYVKDLLDRYGQENVEIDARNTRKEVMGEVLMYIYSGRCTQLDSMEGEIFVAAKKFQLERLQILCENSMSKKLTANNVPNYYLFANKYGANELKQHTLDFIATFYDSVNKTQNWADLIQTAGASLLDDLGPILAGVNCDPPEKRKKKLKR